ncbi:MAG: hypothetical protein K2L11_10720, partial [Muribaculaceae bacterium]|nr:hypothetical protein [Muribaculaceae bacterium]
MKKHYFIAIGLAMATMGAFNASAQRDNRHMESGVTTLIHNDQANPDDVEKTMKGNAPKAPNDNGLPRFAIVGKNNDFYLGIGGQFLGEGVYTWG